MPELFYTEVSAVTTANAHNATILNPDFLSNQKVVPNDWQVGETFSTPAFSIVRYLNGVIFEARPDKMIITESVNNESVTEPKVFDLMQKYVERLPYTPYLAVGLNCKAAIKSTNPAEDILRRFVLPEARTECEIARVNLKVTTGCETSARLFVEIQGGVLMATDQDGQEAVVYSCNFHHDDFDGVDDIRNILDNWDIYKRHLDEYVPKLYR